MRGYARKVGLRKPSAVERSLFVGRDGRSRLVECLLCHNAAAGHDRVVPPDHTCLEHMGVVRCAECAFLDARECFICLHEYHRNVECGAVWPVADGHCECLGERPAIVAVDWDGHTERFGMGDDDGWTEDDPWPTN